MKGIDWRVPALWAVAGGLVAYAAIGSAGVGASDTFTVVGSPGPQDDIFVRRAARHRLVALAGGGVGLAAGLVLAGLRSRWAGAAVGALAGVAIGFGPYWDIGQPPGVPLNLATFWLTPLGTLGLLAGFATVRRPGTAYRLP